MGVTSSQCTYRCVVLPDPPEEVDKFYGDKSQCTYRCVVLPDPPEEVDKFYGDKSQCTYRCVVLPDLEARQAAARDLGLNAPTGAWCSLTRDQPVLYWRLSLSQCTYRCVVLPDAG